MEKSNMTLRNKWFVIRKYQKSVWTCEISYVQDSSVVRVYREVESG